MHDTMNQISVATKWSTLTEIATKLVSPVTNIVLARLLTPEAFGVTTTITMVISFADIFSDAGFQKYIIQHDFHDEKDLNDSTTVAFWTNLLISLIAWFAIFLSADAIAIMVGNAGLGNVLAIAAISLPLTSFSSIQTARFKRDFDFRMLFQIRMIGITVPFFVTIPCAFITRNYWALVLGTLATNLINAIMLTVKSTWRPRFYYSFTKLKKMFSFSWWILLESISVWLTSYIGTFIVGIYLSDYYLGIYKTSMTTVNQIFSMITAATSGPLFSGLSRTKNNDEEFRSIYLQYIGAISILIIPLGVGVFLYDETITRLLLGSQWLEASQFIGLWGLTSSVCLIFGTYNSGIYNAKGKTKLSFFVQCVQLIVLIPTIWYFAPKGFDSLYISRSLVRMVFVVTQSVVTWKCFRISVFSMMKKSIPALICTFIMFTCAVFLQSLSHMLIWNLISIAICILVYFLFMYLLFRENLTDCLRIMGIRNKVGDKI